MPRTPNAAALAQTITVRRREDEPEDVVVLAQAILETQKAAERLLASGLTRRALVVLLSDLIPSSVTQPNRTQILAVLDALPKLSTFLTEPR